MKYTIKALANTFDDTEHTVECVMSVEVIDRHGEIVDIETMSVDNFMLNPVVLQSHEYDKMSVGRVLEIIKGVNEQGQRVMSCKLKFAVEAYDVAKTHWELYKGGYMSAFSIGFRVGAVKTDEAGVTRLLNCELLEISCVSVPANQLALAKSKGLDISPVLKLMPDKELQKAVKELLIEVKEMLTPKEVKTEDKTVTTEQPVAKTSAEIGKARAKNLLEQAIRQLRG